MIFKETSLKGAYLIEMEPLEDERGFVRIVDRDDPIDRATGLR